MNVICKTSVATVFFFAIAINQSKAQLNSSKYSIGIDVGTLVYQGDLSETFWGYTGFMRPAVGVHVTRSLDDYFSLRANLTIGKIGADESTYSSPAYRRTRNFRFSTEVVEFAPLLVWNLYGANSDRRLSPYLMGGAGITFLNTNRDWSNIDRTTYNSKTSTGIGLGIDTLQSLPRMIAVLPVGFGVKYDLTSRLSIHAEALYRFTLSDYVDGFKYAADATSKDKYYGVSVGVEYKLGRDRNSCPSVR
jgi:opacity protein-like surface antigen